MKTPEEIKEALRTCTSTGCGEAYCAYEHDGDCSGSVMRDSLALIEQLEKKVEDAEAAIQERDRIIDLMKEQLRGACKVCKYNETGDYIRCKECCDDEFVYHPLWEYEGLPGA